MGKARPKDRPEEIFDLRFGISAVLNREIENQKTKNHPARPLRFLPLIPQDSIHQRQRSKIPPRLLLSFDDPS